MATLKVALPALLAVAVVALLLVSLRRGTLPALFTMTDTAAPVADIVVNVSRTLAEVEIRAVRLEVALRQLGATARQLEAQEERRVSLETRGRFEQREFCDTAWWWWRKVVLSAALRSTQPSPLNVTTSTQPPPSTVT